MKVTFVRIIKNKIKKEELLKQSQSIMAKKSQIC
jgi:hypothetical protein